MKFQITQTVLKVHKASMNFWTAGQTTNNQREQIDQHQTSAYILTFVVKYFACYHTVGVIKTKLWSSARPALKSEKKKNWGMVDLNKLALQIARALMSGNTAQSVTVRAQWTICWTGGHV